MKTFYEVKGKRFEDLKEAKKYEEELKEKEIAENKLRKEKQDRINEIKSKEAELKALRKKFYKDYGYVISDSSGTPVLDDFFKNVFGL